MSLTIRIRARADRDIDEILEYISRGGIQVGERFLRAMDEQLKTLAEHPGMGTLRPRPPRDQKGMRFLPLTKFRNYLLFYRVSDRGLELVRVLHFARNISSALRETD